MYERAIVDELGCIVAWLVGMTQEEITTHLNEHPEHRVECIKIG